MAKKTVMPKRLFAIERECDSHTHAAHPKLSELKYDVDTDKKFIVGEYRLVREQAYVREVAYPLRAVPMDWTDDDDDDNEDIT